MFLLAAVALGVIALVLVGAGLTFFFGVDRATKRAGAAPGIEGGGETPPPA